ncbi:MAG: IS66 family transposase, partial [Actinobacteria bacterium]|nr:IS66 family transposase [Actinomycetota bacterium]
GELDLERTDDQWIVDIPDIANVVTRVRVPVCRCRRCGRRTQGRHPTQSSDALGAAASQVGPRATALAVELHKGSGLSLARTATVLRRLGLAITPGGVCQAVARAARRAEPTYEAVKAELVASPVISPDETGWRIGGQRAWLWVFATATLTLYHVGRGRGFDQATEVLPPDYAGTLVRDGWAPYRRYASATHQTCLAHLIRRAGELVEALPEPDRWIPREVAEVLRDALGIRDARRAGAIDDAAVTDILPALRRCMDTLVSLPTGHDANRRLLDHLRRERDALFTFLTTPGVDATNWRSEQGVRPAVVNRKVWGGNRSDVGARTQEVLATVLRTATQQGLDVIGLFADLLRSPVPKVAALNLPLTRPPP